MFEWKDLGKLLKSYQVHSQQVESREDELFLAMGMQNGQGAIKVTSLLVSFSEAELRCCSYRGRCFISAAALGVRCCCAG